MAELWAVISNQTIKYQLPHTWFDQISDHKHDIHLYGKLSTKLLAQTANKTTYVCVYENWMVALYGIRSDWREKL